jgi:hypothetical protein
MGDIAVSPQNNRADADVAVRHLLARRIATHNVRLIGLYIKSSARRLTNNLNY